MFLNESVDMCFNEHHLTLCYAMLWSVGCRMALWCGWQLGGVSKSRLLQDAFIPTPFYHEIAVLINFQGWMASMRIALHHWLNCRMTAWLAASRDDMTCRRFSFSLSCLCSWGHAGLVAVRVEVMEIVDLWCLVCALQGTCYRTWFAHLMCCCMMMLVYGLVAVMILCWCRVTTFYLDWPEVHHVLCVLVSWCSNAEFVLYQ